MSYQYLVKIFRWENGTVNVSNIEFSSEEESIAYSKSIGVGQTVKVYVEDEVLYTATKTKETYA